VLFRLQQHGGELQAEPQQAQQQQQPSLQSSEDDEGEDVYARFASYEEMVEHFQKLAAEGHQDEQLAAAAAAMASDMSRTGSLRFVLDQEQVAVTAASSFSGAMGTRCAGKAGGQQGWSCSWWPCNGASCYSSSA